MFRNRPVALMVVFAVLVAGCTQPGAPAPPVATAKPTEAPKPAPATAAPAIKPTEAPKPASIPTQSSLPTATFAADAVDLDAARREGSISWYTSTPVDTAQKIASMFAADTGVKVQLFRSGGEAVLRRFLQEVDAGRVSADVLTISDPAAFNVMMKRDLLVPFKPTNFDKIPPEVKDPQGRWIAQRLNLAAIIARTDRGGDLPRDWTDLTDPKYKGQLVMPDPSFTAIQLNVVATLSRQYGWGFYEKLRANDIMIVQGHQQVSDALKSGERAIAAEGGDSYGWIDKHAGHPMVTIFPTGGAFAIPAPTAVIKGGPQPNAAKAFAEYLIGDKVQGLFASEGIYAARSDAKPPDGNPPLSEIKLLAVDYELVETESNAIKKKFNEIFQ